MNEETTFAEGTAVTCEQAVFGARVMIGRVSRAPLAAAAFLAGAIALVNPAFADECGDTADFARAAARDGTLSGEEMLRIERTIEKAVLRLDLGDEQGCMSELAVLRQTLVAG